MLALVAAALPALAATDAPPADTALAHCASIGAASDRLSCYDKLAGRAAAPVAPAAVQPAPADPPAAPPAAAGTTSLLAATGAPLVDADDPPRPPSLLSRFWELDPADRRGIFNFVGYQPNYVLPVHVTNQVNRSPHSPTQAVVAVPDYRREEAKFQLSLRTKLVQDVPLIGGDLWVAYTQQAFWQVYNSADSKPFRNTDYQPEAIYLLPVAPALRSLPLGWSWRYAQLGLAHQSNGQSDPLSRSWNRVYLGTGFEHGDWSLALRYNERLNEAADQDNNPDLAHYRGRAELQLNWAHGLQTASALLRTNLHDTRGGALQVEWTYPIFRDRPNGLRWYLQAFTGYAETLTDYNFRQTSVGAGLSFLQF